jgi:uncharacterized membrane protein
MIGASVWGALVIPAHARVPIHFNVHGRADGFGSKWIAVLALPLVASCLLALLYAARRHVSGSQRALAAGAAASTAVHTAIHLLLLLGAAGHEVDVALGATLAQAMLMLVIGNYLPTTRKNGLLGIRTPWTLSSDQVWRRTHALGGKLFFALGLLVLCAVVVSTALANIVLLSGLALLALGLGVYSYWLARDQGGGIAE